MQTYSPSYLRRRGEVGNYTNKIFIGALNFIIS